MTPRPGLARLARLRAKKHREAERLFLAEGASLIGEAGAEPVALFTEPSEIRRLSTLTTPTGPVAAFPFLDVPAEELLRLGDRIVLLAGVQDPGNVGTAIRSAHAFGAGVALSRGTADLYNPKTVRATMGSIFHAPVSRDVEAEGFVEGAREAGYSVLGAIPDGGESMRGLETEKVVLVVGSEGAGLPEGLLRRCDGTVSIPSRAASLNAGVAASILLYEAYLRVLP